MRNFVVEGKGLPAAVSLSQDGDDVDILVDGVRVAWFDSCDGTLSLDSVSEEKQPAGVAFDEHGCVKIYHPFA
jgi:hypothetical protein